MQLFSPRISRISRALTASIALTSAAFAGVVAAPDPVHAAANNGFDGEVTHLEVVYGGLPGRSIIRAEGWICGTPNHNREVPATIINAKANGTGYDNHLVVHEAEEIGQPKRSETCALPGVRTWTFEAESHPLRTDVYEVSGNVRELSYYDESEGAEIYPATRIRVESTLPTTRWFGDNRYLTGLEVAKATMRQNSPLFVASGENFPDALSAAPAAHKVSGDLVISHPSGLSEPMLDLIRSKGPTMVYIIGGAGAVSDTVFDQLAAIAPVKRLEGTDRYLTSRAVMNEFWDTMATDVYLTTGRNFPDALAGTPLAARNGLPILLINPGVHAAPTAEFLRERGIYRATILGGHGDDAAGTEAALRANGVAPSWIQGDSRYRTAVRIAKELGDSDRLFLATGSGFADALSVAAVAAREQAPIILTTKDCHPDSVPSALGKRVHYERVAVGGSGVIADSTMNGMTACPGAWGDY